MDKGTLRESFGEGKCNNNTPGEWSTPKNVGWVCTAHFPKLLPNLWSKPTIFVTLLMSEPKIPIYDRCGWYSFPKYKLYVWGAFTDALIDNGEKVSSFTATFNNMQTQPTNAFSLPPKKCSATHSSFRLMPSTVSLSELLAIWLTRALSSGKLGGVTKNLIDSSENDFVGWALNFRVRMLLKGTVRNIPSLRLDC